MGTERLFAKVMWVCDAQSIINWALILLTSVMFSFGHGYAVNGNAGQGHVQKDVHRVPPMRLIRY